MSSLMLACTLGATMSEDPFLCPRCHGDFDVCGTVDPASRVVMVLVCYECPTTWLISADSDAFRRD